VKNPRESLSLGDTVLEFKKHVDEALTGTHFSGHDGDGLVVGLDDQNRAAYFFAVRKTAFSQLIKMHTIICHDLNEPCTAPSYGEVPLPIAGG